MERPAFGLENLVAASQAGLLPRAAGVDDPHEVVGRHIDADAVPLLGRPLLAAVYERRQGRRLPGGDGEDKREARLHGTALRRCRIRPTMCGQAVGAGFRSMTRGGSPWTRRSRE